MKAILTTKSGCDANTGTKHISGNLTDPGRAMRQP